MLPVANRRLSGPPEQRDHCEHASGKGTRVTVHHDCETPSVLRFQLPDARPALLDVRDKDGADPTGPPMPYTRSRVESTGGGLATAPVCGQQPIPPERLLRYGW